MLELPNLSMIFLAAVLFCAVTHGTRSAVAAAVLSFLAYNFFFIEPRFTLTVASPQELLSLFIFLLVAVLTGGLAGRVREQTVAALASVRRTQSLLDLSSKLSGAAEVRTTCCGSWQPMPLQRCRANPSSCCAMAMICRSSRPCRLRIHWVRPTRPPHAGQPNMARGGLAHRHAAQCRLPVPSAAHAARRHRRARREAGGVEICPDEKCAA